MRSPEPLKLRPYVPPGVYVPPFVSPEMEREPPVVGVMPMIVAQVPTAQAFSRSHRVFIITACPSTLLTMNVASMKKGPLLRMVAAALPLSVRFC